MLRYNRRSSVIIPITHRIRKITRINAVGRALPVCGLDNAVKFCHSLFFPIISLSGSLVKPEDAEETPREQVSKYQRWQMGKTTFSYLSMLIFADVFRIVATGDKGKAAS